MIAYSLISCSCSGDYFSVGIYTSLENVYVALKDCIRKDLERYSKEDIQTFYKIIKVNLDSEPLECYEFSLYGLEMKINWGKMFDK